MKQTVKTSRTAGYLEKMFRILNDHYFSGEIEEPIITIQSTPRAYGHVTVAKSWHRADGEQRHELNIGAGTLDRPIENVVATLIHEMVHLHNMQNGIKDCSRNGTYHNKRFKAAAEARDLVISHDPRIGWSITEPTEALINFVITQDWDNVMMGRADGYTARGTGAAKPGAAPGRGKRPSSTRKLICLCCGQSVRATRSVNIICGVCMERMVEIK